MITKKHKMPAVVSYLRDKIKGTQWEGHLFVVGGCCRDLVMGRPIHDVDFTVDLPMGSVKFAEWLRKKRMLIGFPLVFPRYSTAKIRLKKFPDEEYEIVQTRSDKYGPHNADNPEAAFGTLDDDACRRDLTINSLFYDVSADRMLDLCGMALHDIEHHIIRTPAPPEQTFDDDPLRKMRCIRFACKLGWQIDPATGAALNVNPQSVLVASKERIHNEFDKIISLHKPSAALEMLRQSGILATIMPALEPMFDLPDNKFNSGTVWQHSLRIIDAMSELDGDGGDIVLRLAALLCDAGKTICGRHTGDGSMVYPRHDHRAAPVIDKLMRSLRYDPHIIDEVVFLAKYHAVAKSWGCKAEKMKDSDLRKLQHACGSKQRFDRLLTLIHADNCSNPAEPKRRQQVPAIRRRAARFATESSEMYEYRLPIQSVHIRKILKIAPGPKVDRCKDFLMAKAYENPKLSRDDFRKLLTAEYAQAK